MPGTAFGRAFASSYSVLPVILPLTGPLNDLRLKESHHRRGGCRTDVSSRRGGRGTCHFHFEVGRQVSPRAHLQLVLDGAWSRADQDLTAASLCSPGRSCLFLGDSGDREDDWPRGQVRLLGPP